MLLQNYLICEREYFNMGRKKKSKHASNQINKNFLMIFCKILYSLMVAIIPVILTFYLDSRRSSSKQISNIEERLIILNQNYLDMDKKITDMKSKVDLLSNNYNDLSQRVSFIEGYIVSQAPYFRYLTDVNPLDSSYNTATASVHNVVRLGKPSNNSTDIGNMSNQFMLLSYENEDQEVYIWGRYNEYNNWDGNCIINIYKNDQLVLITEGFYNNGDLKSFRQVVPFTNSKGIKVWGISDRIYNETYSSGDTYTYYYENDYIKDFDKNTVTQENILSVDNFEKIVELNPEGHYHGNISNGLYNDDTGNAYIVKYAKDGTVRTLYVGNFKDGHFNDGTGTAWEIAKEENTTYMYYHGYVSNGTFSDNNLEFEHLYTIDDVYAKLEEYNWNIELNWYQ